ncbi:hypothetical protein [Streptomyces sp. RTd22]|uniref:hypothetical protein n=1 Tax=Streptomyces sp. RTd22 TaxID=1841249 RepID=UPI0007C4CED6|nr:hypothetical protein [Streptomyces sp. RTd22]
MDRIHPTPAQGARRTIAVGAIYRTPGRTVTTVADAFGHTTTIRLAPHVQGMRTAAHAAGYDPDQPDQLAALARAVDIDTDQLTAALTGRAQLGGVDETRLARALGLAARQVTG